MLKQLWDYIFLVRTAIDEWKTSMWKGLDVENMDMECKKFSKDVRALDKEMRNWNAFLGMYFYFSVCKKRYNLLNFEGSIFYIYRSRNNRQKYVDFFESCWRTSKCSYQRTTLGTIGKKIIKKFQKPFLILCLYFRLLLSK